MKNMLTQNNWFALMFLILAAWLWSVSALAGEAIEPYVEYRGVVLDKSTGNGLAFANISVQETNISTVSNTSGEFIVKIPLSKKNIKILFRYVGYRNELVIPESASGGSFRVLMEPVSVELPEVSVISKDANALMKAVFENVGKNYAGNEMAMTAFYRETIRRNRNYVSVAEAVVDIYKQPYPSYKADVVKLYKSRKKADYEKLDTLVFKLMGGPFNSLYLDVIKYPHIIFSDDMFANYQFSFDHSTRMDKRLIYVINFSQTTPQSEPLFFGKVYIDAQSMAIKSAVFSMNLTNKTEASKIFIVKKPFNANVIPELATYRMDFFEQNGKWYYGYSRIELDLRVKWKRKLFDTKYENVIEMAVTNWEDASDTKAPGRRDRLRPGVVITDEASGFSDPEFWGEFNVIEPEKPIETAIKKIQRKLEKKD
ncbi:MAG: carboxypeptidase-like regulatory domain-containing protein [Paludibacteraceae bacterium]|nr:carboxypeptidase-like regulatory domain-containing protein [Paludibacteraceae bacterium]